MIDRIRHNKLGSARVAIVVIVLIAVALCGLHIGLDHHGGDPIIATIPAQVIGVVVLLAMALLTLQLLIRGLWQSRSERAPVGLRNSWSRVFARDPVRVDPDVRPVLRC